MNRNEINQWISNYNSSNKEKPVKKLEELVSSDCSLSDLYKFENPYEGVGEEFSNLKLFGENLAKKIKSLVHKFGNSENKKETFEEIIDEIIKESNVVEEDVVEERKQESDKLENLQVLFRRLYSNADGKAQFDLTDDERYLAHAVLQTVLYSMQQECSISFDNTNCINDGENACPMSIDSFDNLGKNSRNLSGDNETDIRIKNNPETRQQIKPETFYFYNCHIEPNKYNNTNIFGGRYGHNFEKYQTQYNKLFLGLADIRTLPDEIQNVVKVNFTHATRAGTLRVMCLCVKNAQSAEEIKDFLEKLAQKHSAQPLGKAIDEILKDERFEAKFNKAKEGFLTKFKNFVIKCFLAIYEVIKWFLTVNLTHEAKDNWKENCKQATKNNNLESFKKYVNERCKSISSQSVEDSSFYQQII